MNLSATGEPVIVQEDTQVHVGIDLRPGTLTLTRNGKGFVAYHALVQFGSVHANPWAAQEVKFSAKGPDGKSVELTVDLLNDAGDGPRLAFPPRSGRSWPSPRPPPETSASPTCLLAAPDVGMS